MMKKRELSILVKVFVLHGLLSLMLCLYACGGKKYEVVFDYNDGSGMSETIIIPDDSYISGYAPTIERANKRLVGWSIWKDNGSLFTQRISKSITLYAQWEDVGGLGNNIGNENTDKTDNNNSNNSNGDASNPSVPKYKVTFDYNNGSGKNEVLYIPAGSEIGGYAPYPVRGNSEVVSWSLEKGGADFEGKIEKEIILYANWITHDIVKYDENFPETVNSRFVEITLNGYVMAISGKVLRIAPGVKDISIISDGTVYDKFAIIIDDRVEDLNITFDNFVYQSDKSFGIKGESEHDYTVNLEVKALGGIDCAKYSTMGNTRAADCIDVPNLNVYGEGTLFLFAGDGENGIDRSTASNGNDGENGTDGKNGGYGIVTNRLEVKDVKLVVSGGDGGKGGKGGNGNNGYWLDNRRDGGKGGRGGDGGVAISAENIVFDKVTLELTGGNGGKGGNGGDGGANNSLLSGLTGGGGGKGGNGGNGGSVFSSTTASVNVTNCIETYIVGTGNSGGSGGSGAGGVDAKSGSRGADGKINK